MDEYKYCINKEEIFERLNQEFREWLSKEAIFIHSTYGLPPEILWEWMNKEPENMKRAKLKFLKDKVNGRTREIRFN